MTASGSKRRLVVTNALYLALARNMGLISRLVFVVVAAVYVGPADYGLFQSAYAWYLILMPLSGGGLQFILGREIGRDPAAARVIVWPSLLVRTALALGAGSLCLLGGWLLQGDERFRLLLTVFAVALVGRSISMWGNAVFTAHHASRFTLKLEFTFRSLEASLALPLLISGQGIVALALVHALSWWSQALAVLWLLSRHLGFGRTEWAPAQVWGLLRGGLPLALALFLVAWQMQGPLVLFKHLAPDAESLGQLALALQAFLMTATVAMAVGSAALPTLSAVDSSMDDRHRFISVITRAGVIGAVGLALGGWAFGTPLVTTVFGDAYAGAGAMLGPALLLFMPLLIGNGIWQVFIAESRVANGLLCALAGALVSTAAVLLMSTLFGAYGSIVGAGTGLTVWVLCLLRRLQRGGETSGIDITHGMASALLSASAALAVFFSLQWLHPLPAFFVALLLLAVMTWKLVVSADERRSIRQLAYFRRH